MLAFAVRKIRDFAARAGILHDDEPERRFRRFVASAPCQPVLVNFPAMSADGKI